MTKSKIFIIAFVVLCLIGVSLYGYEYFTNKSNIEKADSLYKEGKFDEAMPYYKKAQRGLFGTHDYEAWAGEFDIQRLKKDIFPTFKRATNALKNDNTDSLLVAFSNLKSITMNNGSYRIKSVSFDKKIIAQQEIAQDKIITLAKKSEQQNPAEAIKLYSVFGYKDDEYKEYQAKIKSLNKNAFLQKYNEKEYLAALSFYEKMDDVDREKYKIELKEPANHSLLEAAKQSKDFALTSYMNGEMKDVERVTKLLLKVDSTSTYAPAAKTELENLNQEVAYKMGTEEYKAENLDESLHFFAQIPPESPHYDDSKSKIAEISKKLEKEHKDTQLTKKRTEAYAEVKKQLSPYLNNKSSYSVILADSEEANKKFKYTVVYQNGTTPTTKTTDFLKVTDSTYDFFLDDVGMEILSNKGQQITQAGYSNYVGNSQYGTWKENDDGSFWEFYGKYAMLSTLMNSNRIYRDDYNTYNRYYRTSSRPYYGSVYVPLKSAVKQTPRFKQTVANRSQKSWFYSKSAPSRSSSKSTASTSSKSWYYGKQPAKRSSYTSKSTASNRSSYGRSSTASSSSGSYSSGSSSSNKGYKSTSTSSSSSSSSSGYRSSSSSSSRSSSSSSSRTTRSSSSSSRSRSSSSGGK
ncbi:hypothetical protein Fleli_1452 [Bernardetia litoralis DSM 6794]|uniref:Uncharacterized protein n=1 Tax=Bernardetia litoralis (strain ATCC 23117 / DSM 6794 / NBRC 15988 / NCIMB 1366 / Fx l1 / Sio-4) TaxID=880071 RepID=I4AIU3_BERLS|nr:hypothetical protein [Bernardetia litoralis]AFM03878.1 hypothetical protein Fleli_1452 [Bernardetia litoralis DSM 6794]